MEKYEKNEKLKNCQWIYINQLRRNSCAACYFFYISVEMCAIVMNSADNIE